MIIQAWPFNDGGDEKTLLMLKLQPTCSFKGLKTLPTEYYSQNIRDSKMAILLLLHLTNIHKEGVVNSCVLQN